MNALARRLLEKERIFDVNDIADDDVPDAIKEVAQALNQSPPQRDPLLNERQKTHGNFRDNAAISQSLKSSFRMMPGWNRLSDVEREALDMIALKFSRILSGKAMEVQHWEDVVGYAKLALEQCHLGDL